MKIEGLMRSLAGSLGSRSPEGALEIRQLILEAVEEKIAELGCEPGRPFPYNLVRLRLAPRDRRHRKLLEGAFADRAELGREIAARIARAGCRASEKLQVELEFDPPRPETSGAGLEIDFERRLRPLPRVRFTILAGSIARKSFSFEAERIHIGRGAEVMAVAGGLVRRNDIAFDSANPSVSRRHAHVAYRQDDCRFYLVDDNSKTSTLVIRRGQIREAGHGDPRGIRLEDGDEIRVGKAILQFHTVER
jgi:hypothetical protein